MADMNITTPKRKGVPSLRKKQSTKVDLTPMVDLGFLLITFFIFTATLSEANVLKLFLPAGEKKDTKVAASNALSIILDQNNEIYYYEGAMQPKGENIIKTNFKNISSLLQSKKQQRNDELMVIIQSTDQASFKNVVDILDEMSIHQIKRYALVDLDNEVKNILRP
jgi:biopolymer transport protein ExbD